MGVGSFRLLDDDAGGLPLRLKLALVRYVPSDVGVVVVVDDGPHRLVFRSDVAADDVKDGCFDLGKKRILKCDWDYRQNMWISRYYIDF